MVIPSAITSGDTTDFQTWDVNAFTGAIQIIPLFTSVDEWFGVKEVQYSFIFERFSRQLGKWSHSPYVGSIGFDPQLQGKELVYTGRRERSMALVCSSSGLSTTLEALHSMRSFTGWSLSPLIRLEKSPAQDTSWQAPEPNPQVWRAAITLPTLTSALRCAVPTVLSC